jgi:hypothetical protein
MLDARNKMIEGKYEINTGLPHGEGRILESMSGTPSFAQLILDSSSPVVEDSDNAPFTCHSLFVFFGGTEVDEAFAGVFLASIFFSPFALLIAFGFFVWWRPLNSLSCFIASSCCNEAIHFGLGQGHLLFLVLGPWLPPLPRFLILH